MVPSGAKETTNLKENVDGCKPSDTPQQQVQPETSGDGKITKVPDVSEATHQPVTVKEPDSALPAEGGPQKVAVLEAGKQQSDGFVALFYPVYCCLFILCCMSLAVETLLVFFYMSFVFLMEQL